MIHERYAGFWIRALAQLIDSVLLLSLVLVALTATFLIPDTMVNTIVRSIIFLLCIAASLYYQITMPASVYQGTLGKYWLGLKVVSASGGRITVKSAVLRYIGLYLCASFPFLFLFVAFSSRKEGLQDLMARTHVLKMKKKNVFASPAPMQVQP
ncbi:RDD family protein [Bacillus sp. FJAT-42376]|uniref:RDD family protein n=1 Tax=Bacillus sp. FJAT-42376 TaxID=2014076 RepID=UPI0013DE684B|nr:RDD family protein [Bacillus sp. FJAT-42376]